MKRTLAILMLLPLAPTPMAAAATFERLAIAPELGIDRFDRGVAREKLQRELFGAVGSTLVITRTDLYDRFPYTESRTIQVATDPAWNRVLAGDTQAGFAAFDGAGTAVGPLSEPRGLAWGGGDRLYLCDSGNNRIVVLRLESEYDAFRLVPERALDGFSRPWAAAFSDAGTPDQPGDDRLYVAEAGRNSIALVTLGESPRLAFRLGGLGGGVGRFAGPMAVAVGRDAGRTTPDLYVADAHNRRVVHMRDLKDRLAWIGEAAVPFSQVSALDTDDAGNLYLTGPRQGQVAKMSPSLELVATLATRPAESPLASAAPRDFRLVQAAVFDHRDGRLSQHSVSRGVLAEDWRDGGGLSLWRLGIEAREATVDDAGRLSVMLTDRGTLVVDVLEATSQRSLAHRDYGPRGAGRQQFDLAGDGVLDGLSDGHYLVRVTARPLGGEGDPAVTQATLTVSGRGGDPRSQRPLLLGNRPNPFAGATTIRVAVPAATSAAPGVARVEIFDSAGRLARAFEQGAAGSGELELPWDGRDDGGRRVPSGVYFYRVKLAGGNVSGQLVVVR